MPIEPLVRANVTSSVPEWRRPTDQGPNPRHRRASTRESNRGNRGGRSRGRGGNVGSLPRKDPTPASPDTAAPPPKVMVDPPTATNVPAGPSPTLKPDSRPQPAKKNSATVSEDSTSVSPQTSARPQNRRRRSHQGRRPSVSLNNQGKLLSVQTSGRKASTEPSSPNLAKDLPPHLDAATSTATVTEFKSNLDAHVERVRAVAMDRPHTPGSHIDWADNDDSLPDLHDWGYPEDAAASAQPEEPQTSIPPIFEDAPPETIIPEVKIEGEGEPSPDGIKSQGAQSGPVYDAAPSTHKAQKRRGGRSKGDQRTRPIPKALNLTGSVSQDSTLSPIQPASATVITHINKPQRAKRPNSNQGQNSRKTQDRTSSRDNGDGSGHQRGRNGVPVASPNRNTLPAKTGFKADHTPSVQSQAPVQGPDSGQNVNNPAAQSHPKPAEPQGDKLSDKERKEDKPAQGALKSGATDPNPSPATRNDTPHEAEPRHDGAKSHNQRKQKPYNTSHTRSHTYGGRTHGGPQPPDSTSTPNFAHHSSDTNLTPPASGSSRPPNLRQSPHMQSSGLGPAPKSAGFERHSRNHSSPSGVGGTTRPPQSTRPVITGRALNKLAETLRSVPDSPKRDPVPSPDS